MIDNQFYPTPKGLAHRAWEKFKNKRFTSVLEPSAGRADLLSPIGYMRKDVVDCIEIDINNCQILKGKGYRVVSHDFLTYNATGLYSHIIMNPPFNMGVDHVLHAWSILEDGEIVAILNAETIKNPYSEKRKFLCSLIDECGEVEFLQEQFLTEDTLRKTSVEIALVYLKKESNSSRFDFIGDLKKERELSESLSALDDETALIIPESKIENMVLSFNLARGALLDAVKAEYKASRYSNHFVQSILDKKTDDEEQEETDIKTKDDDSYVIKEQYKERYAKLKERAWSTLLRSLELQEKLSSAANKTLEKSFSDITQLEFSYDNIHGFIQGILDSQGDIQNEMILSCFDSFTRYRTGNRLYYKGWKSNDKHKRFAWKLKTTRLILRGRSDYYLTHEDRTILTDFDKTFTLLDGKQYSRDDSSLLGNMDTSQFKELVSGERLTSEYYDLRYYQGTMTWHIFPKRTDLIDRINIIVGKLRQWLPEDASCDESREFFKQYEKAEAINKKLKLTEGEELLIDRISLNNMYENIEESDLETIDKKFVEAYNAVGLEYNGLLLTN